MKELTDILQAWETLRAQVETAALATVVHAEGSTYRKPGARMLILPSGQTIGGVSGGCLEADVAERARRVMETRRAELTQYDTTSDTDLLLGTGLGCRGLLTLFLEPITPAVAPALTLAKTALDADLPSVLATVCRADPNPVLAVGDHALLSAPGELVGIPALRAAAQETLQAQTSRFGPVLLGTSKADVFLEYLPPKLPLVIFGGGPSTGPLTRIAHEMGWNVTVVEHRPAFATAAQFPYVHSVRLAGEDGLPANLELSSSTYAVVMTQNFAQDHKILAALLPAPVAYLGLLGPRQRTERLLQALRQDTPGITVEMTAHLHNPVGLDIGAQTPEQIALAIAAEIQAVSQGHTGGFLCVRPE